MIYTVFYKMCGSRTGEARGRTSSSLAGNRPVSLYGANMACIDQPRMAGNRLVSLCGANMACIDQPRMAGLCIRPALSAALLPTVRVLERFFPPPPLIGAKRMRFAPIRGGYILIVDYPHRRYASRIADTGLIHKPALQAETFSMKSKKCRRGCRIQDFLLTLRI